VQSYILFRKTEDVAGELPRTGWRPRFDFGQKQDFSVLHSVQTASGAHPDSYQMGTGRFSQIKWPGHEADNSPSPNDEVKKGGHTPSLPHTSPGVDLN
jgi:hypothetical protein